MRCLAPVYVGVNLEDIAAPRCFEVERRLREILDIPVFTTTSTERRSSGCCSVKAPG